MQVGDVITADIFSFRINGTPVAAIIAPDTLTPATPAGSPSSTQPLPLAGSSSLTLPIVPATTSLAVTMDIDSASGTGSALSVGDNSSVIATVSSPERVTADASFAHTPTTSTQDINPSSLAGSVSETKKTIRLTSSDSNVSSHTSSAPSPQADNNSEGRPESDSNESTQDPGSDALPPLEKSPGLATSSSIPRPRMVSLTKSSKPTTTVPSFQSLQLPVIVKLDESGRSMSEPAPSSEVLPTKRIVSLSRSSSAAVPSSSGSSQTTEEEDQEPVYRYRPARQSLAPCRNEPYCSRGDDCRFLHQSDIITPSNNNIQDALTSSTTTITGQRGGPVSQDDTETSSEPSLLLKYLKAFYLHARSVYPSARIPGRGMALSRFSNPKDMCALPAELYAMMTELDLTVAKTISALEATKLVVRAGGIDSHSVLFAPALCCYLRVILHRIRFVLGSLLRLLFSRGVFE